jgi:hypothetical protein
VGAWVSYMFSNFSIVININTTFNLTATKGNVKMLIFEIHIEKKIDVGSPLNLKENFYFIKFVTDL